MFPFRPLISNCALLACGVSYLLIVGAIGQHAEAYKWSVQYLIDNSQPVFGRTQKAFPRHNRALAISPDGRFLYAGYHQSYDNSGEVRKIDTRVADFENATLVVLPDHRAKAIAVDDEGRVYLACGATVDIYDADLRRCEYSIPALDCNGVATTRETGSLVLYATEREGSELHRWVLQTRGNDVTGAVMDGLSGDGRLPLPGAESLRGVAVDGKGRIWVADVAANKIFRVERNGEHLVSTKLETPVAIAFEDDRAFVTRYTANEIAILDMDMNVTGTLTVPWEELELSPLGNNHNGALSGIAMIPGGKGFYVANERGQTANQKSTYGRTDENSDVIDGKLYRDSFVDDNEPILHATPIGVATAPASP